MNEVTLVTGASSGIGRAVVERLLAEGHTVVGVARRRAVLAQLERAHPRFHGFAADLAVPESATAIVEFASQHGPIGALINVAGFAGPAPLEASTDELLNAMFETNFLAAFRLTRAVLPQMRARRRGTIVNVLSVCSVLSVPGLSAYCASKAAMLAMTDALRHEVRELGIRVVSVLPGSTKTEAWHRYRDIDSRYGRHDDYPAVRAMSALDRFGLRVGVTPEVVAHKVARGLRRGTHVLVGLDAYFFSAWVALPRFVQSALMMLAIRALVVLGRRPSLLDSAPTPPLLADASHG